MASLEKLFQRPKTLEFVERPHRLDGLPQHHTIRDETRPAADLEPLWCSLAEAQSKSTLGITDSTTAGSGLGNHPPLPRREKEETQPSTLSY